MRKKGTKNKTSIAATRMGTWKPTFLEALRTTGLVYRSAEIAHINRRTATLERHRDPEFSEAWTEALEQHIEMLEEEADRRAVKGTDKPVYQQGIQVGSIREYSDTLLIFRLKALNPEKYRDRVSVDVNYRQQFQVFIAQHNLTKEQIEANPVYRAAAARWGIMGIGTGGEAERSTAEAS